MSLLVVVAVVVMASPLHFAEFSPPLHHHHEPAPLAADEYQVFVVFESSPMAWRKQPNVVDMCLLRFMPATLPFDADVHQIGLEWPYLADPGASHSSRHSTVVCFRTKNFPS